MAFCFFFTGVCGSNWIMQKRLVALRGLGVKKTIARCDYGRISLELVDSFLLSTHCLRPNLRTKWNDHKVLTLPASGQSGRSPVVSITFFHSRETVDHVLNFFSSFVSPRFSRALEDLMVLTCFLPLASAHLELHHIRRVHTPRSF